MRADWRFRASSLLETRLRTRGYRAEFSNVGQYARCGPAGGCSTACRRKVSRAPGGGRRAPIAALHETFAKWRAPSGHDQEIFWSAPVLGAPVGTRSRPSAPRRFCRMTVGSGVALIGGWSGPCRGAQAGCHSTPLGRIGKRPPPQHWDRSCCVWQLPVMRNRCSRRSRWCSGSLSQVRQVSAARVESSGAMFMNR